MLQGTGNHTSFFYEKVVFYNIVSFSNGKFSNGNSSLFKRNSTSGSLQSIASKISNMSNGSRTSIYGVVRRTDETMEAIDDDEALNDGSEDEVMRYLFSHLQAFSACLDAFAHGGNDVG